MMKKLLWFLIIICALFIVFANIPCDGENMIYVAESSVVINLSQDQAWKQLSNLNLAHYYVPGLIKTQITTDEQKGLGTSRRVYQSEKRYINETVVEWQDGSGFTLKLHNDDGTAPFLFSEASFTYAIAPDSEEQVKMTNSLRYHIGMGCLGQWLHDWILAPMIQDRIVEGATNLKHFYETGKPANQ
jgi:hypothetical protein